MPCIPGKEMNKLLKFMSDYHNYLAFLIICDNYFKIIKMGFS